MTPTIDQIIADIIDRELHPDERGKPWSEVRARQHEADRGWWTKAGITVGTLGEWRKLGRQATRAELDAMSEEECRAIYRARYVRPFERIPEPLRSLMIDWSVTSWHDNPAKALQRSLQRRGLYAGSVDGIVGQKTLAALVHDPEPCTTYREVLAERFDYYVDIALTDSRLQPFLRVTPELQARNLRGWIRRTCQFLL